jgi:AcrR family transcriptional regulator
MPRRIDTVQRRQEITTAAIRILARGGTGALTLRSLAQELNGSITLVTHFFANRSDLFEAIVNEMVGGYDSEIADLERDDDDDYSRLRHFLEWLLPLDRDGIEQESGRIALHSMRGEPSVDHFFDVADRRIRELIAAHIAPFVSTSELLQAVDYVRAVTNGITLSAVEHPNAWTRHRQLATLDIALRALNISPATGG